MTNIEQVHGDIRLLDNHTSNAQIFIEIGTKSIDISVKGNQEKFLYKKLKIVNKPDGSFIVQSDGLKLILSRRYQGLVGLLDEKINNLVSNPAVKVAKKLAQTTSDYVRKVGSVKSREASYKKPNSDRIIEEEEVDDFYSTRKTSQTSHTDFSKIRKPFVSPVKHTPTTTRFYGKQSNNRQSYNTQNKNSNFLAPLTESSKPLKPQHTPDIFTNLTRDMGVSSESLSFENSKKSSKKIFSIDCERAIEKTLEPSENDLNPDNSHLNTFNPKIDTSVKTPINEDFSNINKENHKRAYKTPWTSLLNKVKSTILGTNKKIENDQKPSSETKTQGETPVKDWVIPPGQKKLDFSVSSGNGLNNDFKSNYFKKPVILRKDGIRNLGNSCYLSAILQALFAIEQLQKDLPFSPFWSNLRSSLIKPSSRSEESKKDNFVDESISNASTVSLHGNQSNNIDLTESGETKGQMEVDNNNATNSPNIIPELNGLNKFSDFSCLAEFIEICKHRKKVVETINSEKNNENKSNNNNMKSSDFLSSLDVSKLKTALQYHSTRFKGYRQQDAHECWTELLRLLEEEVKEEFLQFLQLALDLEGTQISPKPVSMNEGFSCSPSGFSSPRKRQRSVYQSLEEEFSKTPSKKPKLNGLKNLFNLTESNKENKLNQSREEKMGNEINHERVVRDLIDKVLPTANQFQSTVKMTFQCECCGLKRPSRTEIYHDFSLDIPEENKENNQGCNLEELFQNFFQEESRELTCDNCDNKKAKVLSKLSKVGSTLVFHLKRFQFDTTKNDFNKISTSITFPSHINLQENLNLSKNEDLYNEDGFIIRPLLWENTPEKVIESGNKENLLGFLRDEYNDLSTRVKRQNQDEKIYQQLTKNGTKSEENGSNNNTYEKNTNSFPKKSDCENKKLNKNDKMTYKLVAVVRHMGSTPFSGHYKCDALHRELNSSGENEWQWRRYNDSVVSDVSEAEVLEEKISPYMLFYTKC